MPSPLRATRPRPRRAVWTQWGRHAACCAVLVALVMAGCEMGGRRSTSPVDLRFYPPQPQTPHVVALGTLRGDPPPSDTEVELAMFLFGTEPPPRLALAHPAGLQADGEQLLICDPLLDALFTWDGASDRFAELDLKADLDAPFDVDTTATGELVICDRSGVFVTDAAGAFQRRLICARADCRPGGVLIVDDTVWVSDLRGQRIDVFDLATGQHLHSIGHKGPGEVEFVIPRGMARTPDGNVCVVDTLNNRVQVLTPAGEFVRNIGQPGDSVGGFGRPRDVAVGPDGTVFVTDAFSQRVHAFDSQGAPLLAFGEPGTGVGELALPLGIAVIPAIGHVDTPLPDDQKAKYYVAVAEQLHEPGVRVYAWISDQPASEPVRGIGDDEDTWQPQFPESAAINPHYHDDRCDTCHVGQQPPYQAIPMSESDALCLSCHDGIQAPADPHPIGRPASNELVTTPSDWPTDGGNIACLTCHDIVRHCEKGLSRPASNPDLLRGWDPRQPLTYCMNCHQDDIAGRFSPHQQRDARGRVREDACLFCHTRAPDVPADGKRQFEPLLRVESSQLCLNCHSPHWDLSPEGHVDRPVTPKIRRWMLMRELGRDRMASRAELAQMAERLERPPARLPLGDGKVTCYSCHNPHYQGLFPADSELGALADNPQDRASALRTDWIQLCSECHNR